MKKQIFRGIGTALVTPMNAQGVDYPALKKLIEFQIEQGIHALIAVGTTGEGSTLSFEEKRQVIRCTVETAAGRVPVIAGTGANDTAAAIANTRMACQEGVDGVLVVTPYYNKATQTGLIAHYTAVADASDKPVILYNVPGRTGCNLLPATARKLAEHPNIVAIKEASGNMAQMVQLRALCGDSLGIYSGEDAITQPMLAMGALGCISVTSNIVPHEMAELANRFFAGDVAGAAQMQCRLLELTDCLFSQVNPIPAKAALSAMGICEDYVRLPLTPMEEPYRGKLLEALKKLEVLK